MKMILVTGGAGYIGSHIVVELLERNFEVVILDNLSNSSIEVINRIQKITNKSPLFIEGDIRNAELVNNIFINHKIDAVIHMAGLKAVGESVEKPILYYKNNIEGSINLFSIMEKHNINNLVFSSSATVYGNQTNLPYIETMELKPPTSPYGETKLTIENILKAWVQSKNSLNVSILRYFNPVGAHKSGLIGEDPSGVPNNLMPYICQTASGKLKYLNIYGNDYNTIDGTGVRDYIHVLDLASGHIEALKKCSTGGGINIYNIGTGKGISVLQLIKVFETVNNINIKYKFAPRRSGDIDEFYADSTKIKYELGWHSKYAIEDMCIDAWNWQVKNPKGY